ncbi:MAG: hypothetical protein AB1571_03975 [Nanoarchaeota archaeon]
MDEEPSLTNVIVDLNNRARVLEERYNLLRERLLVVNQNMVEEYKKVLQDIKAMNSDIRELKEELVRIKETIKEMITEMEAFARKDNLKILEKYINMWNPMNFVTEREVRQMIKEEKGGRKNTK